MKCEYQRTHNVAVGAYILKDGQMLLLLRATPPLVWAPPGGRLRGDEDPLAGLKREVLEECNLKIETSPVEAVWFGEHRETSNIAIFYECKVTSGVLQL